MSKVIVDIETVGAEFDTFDEMSKEYLLKFAETEEEKEEAKDKLGFSPLTGEIVAIGMLSPDSGKGAVYFQSPGKEHTPSEEANMKFISDTEAGILRRFWNAVKNFDQIITFNGRSFDAPFLIIRSAIHHIKPTQVIMPNRYSTREHIDLFDQLNFFGAVRRKFNLHMWCRTFGIHSPKQSGVTGNDVKALFAQQRYLDIAKYCTEDLRATKELYDYWNQYIRFAVS